LSTTFTPADLVNYTASTASVPLRVVMSSTLYVTSDACGAAALSGNALIDSFNSNNGTYSQTRSNSGGNISVNGGSTLSGNAAIEGILSTVHPTIGNCSQGNGLTVSGNAKVPAPALLTPVMFVTPGPFTAGASDVTVSGNSSLILTAGNYRNITISGNGALTLEAGTYNINTITVSGNGKLIVIPNEGTGIVLNVAGLGSNQPVTFTGSAVGDPAGIAANLLINYGGTSRLSLSGNADTYAMVYAPNAPVTLSGRGDWFGSMVVYSLSDSGNGAIHFDSSLSH